VLTKEVRFFSDGVPMGGLLRLPEDAAGPLAVVVHPPGWLGVANGPHYEPWHEAFVRAGFAVFVFDYRGFGASEGEPGWIRPDRQVDDLLAAVAFVGTLPEIDPDRIGVFGMGVTGGGHAIIAAAADESIKCVVAQTLIADGADWLHRMRREHEWVELVSWVRADRVRWAVEGTGELVHPRIDLMVEPPERRTHNPRRAIDQRLPQEYYLRNADLMMRYRPIDHVHRIAPRALMVVAVDGDVFTFADHAVALYEKAGAPKTLLRQTNTTHWESYRDNFDELSTQMADWFTRHLVNTPPIVRSTMLERTDTA
jgi:uncharacterized protein